MKAHDVGLFDSLIYLEYVFEHFSNINNEYSVFRTLEL